MTNLRKWVIRIALGLLLVALFLVSFGLIFKTDDTTSIVHRLRQKIREEDERAEKKVRDANRKRLDRIESLEDRIRRQESEAANEELKRIRELTANDKKRLKYLNDLAERLGLPT